MKLDVEKIQKQIGQPECRVSVYNEIDSTQKQAKREAVEEIIPHAYIANQQYAGYGKYNRHFFAPSDSGLYLSILIPRVPLTKLTTTGLLTTGIATKLVNILENYYPGKHFTVKWVNDILLNKRKVCGILCETEFIAGRTDCAFVIGIGLNLCNQDFPADLQNKAGYISDRPVDRNKLAADIISSVLTLMDNYETGQFLSEYRERLAINNHLVKLQLHDHTIEGRVAGIDDQGQLILQTDDHEFHHFNNGEVTRVIY